jgi:hypothetical protein
LDAVSQTCQSGAKYIGYARGLDQQSLQFWEKRALPIGLIKNLLASYLPHDDSYIGQALEFPLHSANTRSYVSRHLPEIEGLVRVIEKQGQYFSSGFPKQRRCQSVRPSLRTHNRYNCTQTGYAWQPSIFCRLLLICRP